MPNRHPAAWPSFVRVVGGQRPRQRQRQGSIIRRSRRNRTFNTRQGHGARGLRRLTPSSPGFAADATGRSLPCSGSKGATANKTSSLHSFSVRISPSALILRASARGWVGGWVWEGFLHIWCSRSRSRSLTFYFTLFLTSTDAPQTPHAARRSIPPATSTSPSVRGGVGRGGARRSVLACIAI